jgi:Cu(I)/Ag(I) efflux system membrane fusion protein
MNPSITSPTPAKDEMGMDYIPVYADEGQEDPGLIKIPSALVNNLGVRTELVRRETLWRLIETVGYVDYDENRISHVHLRTEGWIEHLKVRSLGARVRQGELLFEIYSPQLVNAQQEYLQALQAGDRAMVSASRERLAALGIADSVLRELERTRRARQQVPIYAGHGGVVSLLNIREGMYVEPEVEVMTLADLGSIWVQVDVFERQADWVATGQRAEMRLPYIPGETWEGRVEYVYPALDRKTRSVKLRLRFDNPDERLKPGMYAKVTIYGSPRADTLSIPREALIRRSGAERVIVAQGEGRFRAVEVKAGMESGDRVEILSGLSEGTNVVVSAQFMIDSEASIKAAFRRMTEPSPEPDPPIQGQGVVHSVDAEGRQVNLTHDPIPALGWPAMTMDFKVAEGVALSGLRPGAKVRFNLKRLDDVTYLITGLSAEQVPASATPSHAH